LLGLTRQIPLPNSPKNDRILRPLHGKQVIIGLINIGCSTVKTKMH
jgi:hypothetical protein